MNKHIIDLWIVAMLEEGLTKEKCANIIRRVASFYEDTYEQNIEMIERVLGKNDTPA